MIYCTRISVALEVMAGEMECCVNVYNILIALLV